MEEQKMAARQEPLILVNIVEEFVRQEVKRTIQDLGACGCEICYLDACAMALNALPPKYVTTTKGALLSQITETQLDHKTDILVEVTKAVMLVMKHPRH